MNETKGLVMKITNQYIVVLCDDGKFRNLPLPKQVPNVGERITVPLQTRKRPSVYWLSAAAVFFLIFLSSIFGFAFQTKYYQVVAIDINPSLELYLDAHNRIIQAKPLNKDAEKVLSAFSWKKAPLNDAISQILEKSIDFGYINQEKTNLIMITVAKIREEGIEVQSKSIEALVERTFQAESINGFLKVEKTDKSLYSDSKEKRIPLNKLILIQQAKQFGIQLDPNKAVSEPVSQFLHDAGVNVKQFFVPVGPEAKESALPTTQSQEQTIMQKNRESGQGTINDAGDSSSNGTSETSTSNTGNYGNTPSQENDLNTQVPTNSTSTSQSDSSNTSTNNTMTNSNPTNTPANGSPTNSTPTNSDPINTPASGSPTNSTPTNSDPINTPASGSPTNSTPTNSDPTMNSSPTSTSTGGDW